MTHNAPNLSLITENALTVKLVNSIEDFKSLQQDWDELYEQCDRNTVFSSWDWVFTWWEVFNDQFDRELFILCFYQEEILVGIAPFQITKSYPKSLVQGKTLQFIGNGEAYADSIISEFQDFIVLPEMESVMIDSVSKYLTDNKNKWDFADFEFLLKDALILQCFKNDNSQIKRKKIDYGVRFFIPKHNSFEQYHEAMGRRWRKMFTKKSRIMARDGEVTVKSTETLESIEPAIEQLADMHCCRWREKTGSCIFDSSRFTAFHTKVMQRLVPKKRAAIKTIYQNDEALASYYIFSDKNRTHYYQSGFFAKYANKYSPLFILVCNEIGDSIKNNQFFDFMFADDAESYKKEQFACDAETMYRLRWTTQPYRFAMFDGAKTVQNNLLALKDKLKKLKNKAKSTKKKISKK